MEIEKKYLIADMPADLADFVFWKISQSYISRSPVIRIRRREKANGIDYRLTVKGEGLTEREEFELPLSRKQYEELLAKKEGRSVTKTRYLVPLADGHTAELDVFEGEHEGLCIVEVEFSSVEEMKAFVPPVWFGEDVSSDTRYHNSELSK